MRGCFKSVCFLTVGGMVLSLLCVCGFADSANDMHAKIDNRTIFIQSQDRVLVGYRYYDVPFKPYVAKLFTPDSRNILLDSPPDHVHHHGLMFAVSVDGTDFWEEQIAPGRQRHVEISSVKVDSSNGMETVCFAQSLEWMNPANGQLLLNEQRTLELAQFEGSNATVLTWRSIFSLPHDKQSVVFSGNHYFGLGMRFVRSMDEKGTFFNADNKTGKVYRGDERLVRSKWCAYTADIQGKPVTVAMLDHPENTRYPATWFTMAEPFAYLSATMALHEEPLTVKAGQTLSLCYGVVVWDGMKEPAQVEQMYQRWLNMAVESIKNTQRHK